MNQRQTADAMESEQALAELAEAVELLRAEQRKREQQLEQPAEQRQEPQYAARHAT